MFTQPACRLSLRGWGYTLGKEEMSRFAKRAEGEWGDLEGIILPIPSSARFAQRLTFSLPKPARRACTQARQCLHNLVPGLAVAMNLFSH